MASNAESLIRKLDTWLTPLGAFRARAMFGGYGLYLDDVMFGLIFNGRLYLKTDGENRPDFEKAKSEPFVYDGKTGAITMSYWLCPAAVLKDVEKLQQWIGKAHAAARRVKAAKPKRKPHRPRKPRDFPF